jgi:hypothetical protein
LVGQHLFARGDRHLEQHDLLAPFRVLRQEPLIRA